MSQTGTRLYACVRKWWESRGNRELPKWFFHPLLTIIISTYIYTIYGAFVTTIVDRTLKYVLQQQLKLVIPPLNMDDVIFIGITIIISVALFFVAFYVRKRIAYTFKNKTRMRKIVLQRDRWSSLGMFGFVVNLILAFYTPFMFLVITFFFSMFRQLQIWADVSTPIIPFFPIFLGITCSSAIFFLFLHYFLDTGIKREEKLTYVVDSLVKFSESRQPKEYEELKKDAEYLADRFVTVFGELVLYAHRSIAEVDLGRYLTPILWALFWGNDQEKTKARELLSELQKYLREESKRQVNIVNWLSKSEEAFPRLSELKDTLRLKSKVKKGILSATPESLRYIATIATIASAIVSVIGFVLLHIYS